MFCALVWVNGYNSAQAQGSDLESVLACDKIKEPEDRLKCFNTIVEILKQRSGQAGNPSAGSESDLAVGDTSQSAPVPPAVEQATPEDLFGNPPPPPPPRKLAREARPESPAEPEKARQLRKISSGIRRFWRNNDGDYVILLENGQIWQTLDASSLSIPQDPVEATVKRGFLGGYKMVVRNQSRRGLSGKVKRIR